MSLGKRSEEEKERESEREKRREEGAERVVAQLNIHPNSVTVPKKGGELESFADQVFKVVKENAASRKIPQDL